MGEKFGHDGIWESHLAQELWNTDVTLDAVLEEQTMNLQDILTLSPGDRLVLRRDPDALVQMRCGGKTVFEAVSGKNRGRWLSGLKKILLEERLRNGPPPIAEKTEHFSWTGSSLGLKLPCQFCCW